MANWANVATLGDPSTADWQNANLSWIEPIHGQRWQVYRPAAAAFEGLLTDLAKLGYSPISSGGYNYRNIRGGDTLSQHAFGTAIDLNAMTNPQGQSATDIPHAAELAKKWGLEWGGNWANNPDPMHFEYTGGGGAAPTAPAAAANPQQAFFQQFWPEAVRVSQQTGVDPRIILAQTALETGYGKSAPNMNYFGIKGGSGEPIETTEVINGRPVRVMDRFRGYKDASESFTDYGQFLMGDRYRAFREAKGLDAQTAALQASGYATDPEYGSKVFKIASGIPEGGYGAATTSSPASTPAGGGGGPAGTAPVAPTAPKAPDWDKGLGQSIASFAGGGSTRGAMAPIQIMKPQAVQTISEPGSIVDPNRAAEGRNRLAMALARLNSGKLFVG